MDSEILEMLSVISFVISVVVLIVFFVMASNIATIKKAVTIGKDYDSLMKDAEKALFTGDLKEGIRLYHLAAYEVSNESVGLSSDPRIKRLKLIAEKITKSGGVISQAFADDLQKKNIQ